MRCLGLYIFLLVTSFFYKTSVAQTYQDGYIIKNSSDTVFCKILNHKKKREQKNDYYEIKALLNTDTLSFQAYQILGYKRSGEIFKSFYDIGVNGDTIFFFGKLVMDDLLVVYEKLHTKQYPKDIYFFRKRTDNGYIAMSSTGNIVKVERIIIDINRRELFWSQVLLSYLGECEKVRNKILAKYYNPSDFIFIARDYNGCFE